MKKIIIKKTFLIKEYINNKKSKEQLAKELNCSTSVINSRLQEFKFEIRTRKQARKLLNIIGNNSTNYKHGKYCIINHIKYRYEPKAFNLDNTTYRPDFYLPKTNEYIEIKGYWRNDAKTKFKLFKKLYPKIKVKILMKPKLQILGVL